MVVGEVGGRGRGDGGVVVALRTLTGMIQTMASRPRACIHAHRHTCARAHTGHSGGDWGLAQWAPHLVSMLMDSSRLVCQSVS